MLSNVWKSLRLNIFFLILMMSIFASYFYSGWYFRAITLILGCMCLGRINREWFSALSRKYWYAVIILFLFALLTSYQTRGLSLVIFFIFISQILISNYFLSSAKLLWTLDFVFYAFLALSVGLVIFLNYGPSEFDSFFGGVGRNGYSAILFALMIGYCTRQILIQKSVSIMLILLTFAVMFPLFGRTSLAATGAVLIAVIVMRLCLLPKLYSLSITSLIILLAFIFIDANFVDYLYDTNFRSGLESERWPVFHEWLDNIGLFNLFFGVDLSTLKTVQELENNPHNAFIRLHYFFGAGLAALMLGVLKSFICLVIDRQYFLLILFATIMFKCFFDIIYFVGDMDFLLYPLLFYGNFRIYFLKSSYY